MDKKMDDLEAIKVIINTLENFEISDRQRILRWTLEKMNINIGVERAPQSTSTSITMSSENHETRGFQDIKTFISEKNPNSDNQFAACVAYYYKFQAPPELKKDEISSEVLQEACRLASRVRLGDPGKTLRNAMDGGLLNKGGERGYYSINTVGENLVAMALPGGTSSAVKKTLRISGSKNKKSNLKSKRKKNK